MVKVKINGREHKVEKGYSIAQIIQSLNIKADGSAVALNWSVVPKKELDKVIVNDGDEIEIIRAVAGGI